MPGIRPVDPILPTTGFPWHELSMRPSLMRSTSMDAFPPPQKIKVKQLANLKPPPQWQSIPNADVLSSTAAMSFVAHPRTRRELCRPSTSVAEIQGIHRANVTPRSTAAEAYTSASYLGRPAKPIYPRSGEAARIAFGMDNPGQFQTTAQCSFVPHVIRKPKAGVKMEDYGLV